MKELIMTLLYLGEASNHRLAIDPDDGKVYEIGEENGEITRLHPITDPSQTIAVYDRERLVTFDNITAINRYCNGHLTEWQRLDIGRETALQRAAIGTPTDGQRNANGFATETERELIGAGKVNLPPFSAGCPPEVEGVARKIETLLRRAIGATNKAQTLENLMAIHRDAAKYAAAGNIFKLNQIEGRLRGIVAKQGAIKTSEETLRRRRRRRMLMFKITVAVVCITGAGLWGYIRIAAPSVNDPPQRQFSPPTPPARASASPLDAAFEEYERETGKKIYPAGRACIQRAATAAGVQDNKQEILKIIKNNVN